MRSGVAAHTRVALIRLPDGHRARTERRSSHRAVHPADTVAGRLIVAVGTRYRTATSPDAVRGHCDPRDLAGRATFAATTRRAFRVLHPVVVPGVLRHVHRDPMRAAESPAIQCPQRLDT